MLEFARFLATYIYIHWFIHTSTYDCALLLLYGQTLVGSTLPASTLPAVVDDTYYFFDAVSIRRYVHYSQDGLTISHTRFLQICMLLCHHHFCYLKQTPQMVIKPHGICIIDRPRHSVTHIEPPSPVKYIMPYCHLDVVSCGILYCPTV